MAGLWNRWVNYTTGEEISSFAVITTEANDLMRHIHDRMPVLLPRADARHWLDTSIALPDRLALLKPYPAHEMEAYEVTREVNKTIHDYPQLLEPVGERLRVQAGAGL
jgi:putative SOS response-associated peptidase YedK